MDIKAINIEGSREAEWRTDALDQNPSGHR
jgi:hypothetical protein